MATKDTVGDKYYQPVRISENFGSFLFWASGILSIFSILIDSKLPSDLLGANTVAIASEALNVLFPVFVVALFIQGIAHRLYFLPRAEEARRANFLSDGYGVSLSDEQTEGYYNNTFDGSVERVAANCMESAFFTASISKEMLKSIRIWSAIYLTVYLVLLVSRRTDIEMIELAAGVVFSEAVLSNWLRCEFLRHRSEDVYERLRRLFADNSSMRGDHWSARAQETLLRYETTKAIAAIPVSSKHYLRMNDELSSEWDRRRKTLGF